MTRAAEKKLFQKRKAMAAPMSSKASSSAMAAPKMVSKSMAVPRWFPTSRIQIRLLAKAMAAPKVVSKAMAAPTGAKRRRTREWDSMTEDEKIIEAYLIGRI